MLVQKGPLSKRTLVLLIALGVIVLGGGGFIYFSYFASPKTDDSLVASTSLVEQRPKIIKLLDLEFLEATQLYSLKKNPFAGFADQTPGIVVSASQPLPLAVAEVTNPKVGNLLIVSWQLPEIINFEKVKIYRSEQPDLKGELIIEVSVTSDQSLSRMSYRDAAVSNGQIYYYLAVTSLIDMTDIDNPQEVESVPADQIDEMQISARSTDEIPPDAPINITVTSGSPDQIRIAWLNPKDEDFYQVKIYRSPERDSLGEVIYEGPGENIDPVTKEAEYFDNKAEPNQIYYYTVTSQDITGNESSRDLLSTPVRDQDYNPFAPLDF